MAATHEYMVRPPMPPVHFFLIDVSHPAITTGATAAVCSSIAKVGPLLLRSLQSGRGRAGWPCAAQSSCSLQHPATRLRLHPEDAPTRLPRTCTCT